MPIANLSIGLSALQVNQRVLDIIGENISNASTPGYHRQVANLVETTPTQIQHLVIGSGVSISDIRRQSDSLLENALTSQTSSLSDTTAQLNTLQQVESLLTPSDGSVTTSVETFFNQLSQLAAHPDDVTQRQTVLGSAAALSGDLNAGAGALDQLRENADVQIKAEVGTINSLDSQIADLNDTIRNAAARGISANDQLDQRDQLINDLAQHVGVQTIAAEFGQRTVLVGGIPVVTGSQHLDLQTTIDKANQAVVTASDSAVPLTIMGGTLGGLLLVRNQALPAYQSRLDTLASELIKRVNSVHATGLGLNGPLTQASGQQAVKSVTAPLSQAQLAFPPQAGSLFVTVTQLATGKQTLTEIPINPSQSLQDVAAALSAVNGGSALNAVADAQTGTLKILAQPGYAFDFAGRLPSAPSYSSGYSSTTTAQLGGSYSGKTNDAYTFEFVGSGTVGVTPGPPTGPGLTLQVKNAAGTPVASLNIGQGYEAGTPLQIANGVTVTLSSGTVTDGDSFSTPVVAQADTAGILTALGINSFFAGANASTIAVQPDLLAHPDQLAASQTGQPGDGANLQRLSALRDTPFLANGTQTFQQFAAALVGDVGTQVQQLNQEQSHQQLLGQQLQAQQQSVSGVDPNEELVNLLQFQRGFQLASRYVESVNTTLDDLLQLVK
jgi:flagellar hook-associated protein 1 FlgK